MANLAEVTGLNLVPPPMRMQIKHWITDGVALAPLKKQLSHPKPPLLEFLRAHAPAACWGNRSKVAAWAACGGDRGRTRAQQRTEELRERFAARMICHHQYHSQLRRIRTQESLLRIARQTGIMFRLWRGNP